MSSESAATGVISPAAFVGRDREIKLFAEALLAQPPTVVLLEGEAGVGKTRLIEEFLASEAGKAARALVACCPPFHQPQTLGPITDATRQAAGERVDRLALSRLAGALRPLFPEWADDLPPLPEPLADATAERHRIFRALAELLDGLQVTLLVVEDAHWADEPTLEFLVFLASQRPRKVRLVVTYRPEDVPAMSLISQLARLAGSTAHARLVLEPFDVEATARMVSSMIGDEPVSDDFATFLHRHADGLPLAVEESVRLMGMRADLTRRYGKWVRHHLDHMAVPPTVRDAVLERAARLPPEAQTVLCAAAVLTDPSDWRTLKAVSALAPSRFHAGLLEALNCKLLAEDRSGLVSFRHALAARAVHEAIPIPERRQMHQRAGRTLEDCTPQPLARLAYHFREAGETASWCRYSELAADLAMATGDEATAAAVLHEIITQGNLPPDDIARLTNKIPLVLLNETGRLETLVRALRSALDAGAGPAYQRADLRCQLGRVLIALDDRDAAYVELERAIEHLTHDPVALRRTQILLGWPLGTSLASAQHLQWLKRSADMPASAAPAEQLVMLVNRATALLLLGEDEGWAEAARLPTDAPTAQELLEVARGHVNIAQAAILWGRYAQGRHALALGLRLSENHHYAWLDLDTAATEMQLDWLAGSWDGLAERAELLGADSDTPKSVQQRAILVSALLSAATGSFARAEDLAQSVLRETRKLNIPECCIEPAALLARLHIARGRTEDALAGTDELSELVARRGIWIWATDLAPARVAALVTAGRVNDAGNYVNCYAEGVRRCSAPTARSALLLCRAVLAEARGEHRTAATLFGRAARAWAVLPRPYDALLAREQQARCLAACGEAEAGTSLLSEIRQQMIVLGAIGDAERVVATLRARGVSAKRPQRGGWNAYGDRLSPRELEVARLVVAGHTNREIANILSRSPKTVAAQLNSAMRKLAVSSRTALAVRVMETGTTDHE